MKGVSWGRRGGIKKEKEEAKKSARERKRERREEDRAGWRWAEG